MNFFLVSPQALEDWSWADCETGIGGCEQAVCEMAWRLARRGQNVTVYATPPWRGIHAAEWRGVRWEHYKNADFSQPGVWVLHRCPEFASNLISPSQILWMAVKDWDYDCTNLARMDRVLVLCRMHKTWLEKRHPELSGKMHLTSHGVKVDLIEELERQPDLPKRNPRKIVYASSPDRGLVELLQIFAAAQDTSNPEAQLELHVFYGFNGIEQLAALHPHLSAILGCKKQVLDLADKIPGVHMRGRVTQHELYRELLSAGLIVYPSTFPELTWGIGLEAQACGVVPITAMYWAQWENTKHGIAIAGNPVSPDCQKRFSGQIRMLTRNPAEQDRIRRRMMPYARQAFDWETVVGQWMTYAQEDYARHGSNILSRMREQTPSAGA